MVLLSSMYQYSWELLVLITTYVVQLAVSVVCFTSRRIFFAIICLTGAVPHLLRSGALDVMVVEHEDGAMSCTPFHVRFSKVCREVECCTF